MKPEDAIEWLNKMMPEWDHEANLYCATPIMGLGEYVCTEPEGYVFKAAIEALEKQIPKEPKKESMCSGNAFDSWDKYNCPDCNNFLHSGARSLVSKYTMPKYCCRCGQALRWE